MGAWATIILAKRLSIQDLHLMGESMIVINWLKGRGTLQVAILESWKNRIIDLLPFFKSIYFPHIYRENNIVADDLSKLALNSLVGHISYNKWTGEHEGPVTILKL